MQKQINVTLICAYFFVGCLSISALSSSAGAIEKCENVFGVQSGIRTDTEGKANLGTDQEDLTDAEQNQIEAEINSVKYSYRDELRFWLRRQLNRVKYTLDRLPGRSDTLILASDPVAETLWTNSVILRSEFGVYEALDANGNVLFHTKAGTSDEYAKIHGMQNLKALLLAIRNASATNQIVRIRARHTHPQDSNYDYTRFSREDRRALLAEKSLIDLTLSGDVALNFEIVFQLGDQRLRRTVVIPANFSEVNNDYYTPAFKKITAIVRKSGTSVRDFLAKGMLADADTSKVIQTAETGQPNLSALRDPRLPWDHQELMLKLFSLVSRKK
jgi:hypothetical protein